MPPATGGYSSPVVNFLNHIMRHGDVWTVISTQQTGYSNLRYGAVTPIGKQRAVSSREAIASAVWLAISQKDLVFPTARPSSK
jgi:hypothetical protein